MAFFPSDTSQSPWTNPDDGVVYDYINGVWTPQPGESSDLYVKLVGDEMTGALTSPALTTGPDDDNKSILYMDDGQDSYNGGPHQLEAKGDVVPDWSEWIRANESPAFSRVLFDSNSTRQVEGITERTSSKVDAVS